MGKSFGNCLPEMIIIPFTNSNGVLSSVGKVNVPILESLFCKCAF